MIRNDHSILSGISRRSPSPSPLQRTRSNDSFGKSPCSSRGVSPVQSYLQGQWPKDIRNSLPSRSDGESQTDGMECEIESCENCNSKGSIKMLTDEGKALKELRRIGNLRERHISPIRQTIIYNSEMIGSPRREKLPISFPICRKSRQASLEHLNEEIIALNKSDDEKCEMNRYIATPTDGRRPPRPRSSESGTQTDSIIHICDEKPDNKISPCHSPAKSRQSPALRHPPSPGTNKTFLFKREPPDGAEVVKPKSGHETSPPDFWPKVVRPAPSKITHCPSSNGAFQSSVNSNFVRYKPQVKLS